VLQLAVVGGASRRARGVPWARRFFLFYFIFFWLGRLGDEHNQPPICGLGTYIARRTTVFPGGEKWRIRFLLTCYFVLFEVSSQRRKLEKEKKGWQS